MGGVITSHFLYLIFKVLGFWDFKDLYFDFMSLFIKKHCIFARK